MQKPQKHPLNRRPPCRNCAPTHRTAHQQAGCVRRAYPCLPHLSHTPRKRRSTRPCLSPATTATRPCCGALSARPGREELSPGHSDSPPPTHRAQQRNLSLLSLSSLPSSAQLSSALLALSSGNAVLPHSPCFIRCLRRWLRT